MEEAFYLRCRTVENEYDASPRLGRVLPCCVRARQVQTWARVWQGVSDGGEALCPDLRSPAGRRITVCARKPGEENLDHPLLGPPMRMMP